MIFEFGHSLSLATLYLHYRGRVMITSTLRLISVDNKGIDWTTGKYGLEE